MAKFWKGQRVRCIARQASDAVLVGDLGYVRVPQEGLSAVTWDVPRSGMQGEQGNVWSMLDTELEAV